jgi:hypothetical protein
VAGPLYSLFASGVPVNIYAYTPVPATNPSTSTVFATDILMTDGVAVLQTITTPVRFIPIVWYLANNCSETLPSVNDVITNEALWEEFNLFGDSTAYQNGYTVQGECNNGVFYNYCYLPASCGSVNNCYGTCANTNQSCKLNTTSSTFSCVNNASSYPWWWWVIFGIIILIIIAILILIIWYASRPASTTTTVTTVPGPAVVTGPTYYSTGYEGESIII